MQRVLADVDPITWEFFWRGAGRALYFSPGHMMQPLYSPWIAAEMEAPNERAFKILKAGISWPTNIVNMRHPEIFEDLINRRGADEEFEGTIRHGVAASTTMAMDITPGHPLVMEYLEYKPKSDDPKVQSLWEKLVREPVYRAVHRYQPILSKHKMMDQVFRLQDLDALVDRLEPGGGRGTPPHSAELTGRIYSSNDSGCGPAAAHPPQESNGQAAPVRKHRRSDEKLRISVFRICKAAVRSLRRELEGRKGAVVVFWSCVCSHCIRYDGYLNAFAERHPELALLAVASRRQETPHELLPGGARAEARFPDPGRRRRRPWRRNGSRSRRPGPS